MLEHDKGDEAELRVAASLKACGWSVLFPYSDSKKYDLVAEKDGEFRQVQVKSSNFNGTSITFQCYNTCSMKTGRYRTEYTEDDIDGIGVYSRDIDNCYWVPVSDLNKTQMSLNVQNEDAKNPASEYCLTDAF